MLERMEQRWLRRTGPARAAAAQAEVRELANWAAQALRDGCAGDVAGRARAVMAAHADAGAASGLYVTAWLFLAAALAQLGEHASAAQEFGGLVQAASGEVTVLRARLGRAGQLALLGRLDEADAECQLAERAWERVPSAAHVAVYRCGAAGSAPGQRPGDRRRGMRPGTRVAGAGQATRSRSRGT
jgi:hypothetical protein